MADATLLEEQLAYYRARASEYDEWWERRGRYDRGEESNARWRQEIADVRRVFDGLPLEGEVAELAAGTGYWTELLASRASHVTVFDGSPEMIAINQARLGELVSALDYQEVDLFDWRPVRRWDALVFCFWISHVPRDRLKEFFIVCRDALVGDGTVFFLDGQRTEESTAVGNFTDVRSGEVTVRKLNDGRAFRVVKNFYEPDELVEAALAAGLHIEVQRTPTYFQFGVGRAG